MLLPALRQACAVVVVFLSPGQVFRKSASRLSQCLGVWRLCMLGTETHADDSRGDALQERPAVHELENPGRLDTRAAEDALDNIILDGDLHPLCRARGDFAALLHAGEFAVARRAGA